MEWPVNHNDDLKADAMPYVLQFFDEVSRVAGLIPADLVEMLVSYLRGLREKQGRLFIIGIGGSAANAAHAVNDFRKIARIEAYAPTDNVAELTARVNDESWETFFAEWLRVSRLDTKDALLILSTSGGNREKSRGLKLAIDEANLQGASVYSIVGPEGGDTFAASHLSIRIPAEFQAIAMAEAFQAVLWHLIVNHPGLCQN